MLSGVVGLEVREDTWPDPAVPFTDLGDDVLPGDTEGDSLYPHDYVAAAYLAGITRGTTATTFAPYDGITRAQLLTMVVRAMESLHPGDLVTPPGYFECSIGDFDPLHGPNMRIAEYNELLEGLTGYGPGWSAWAPATRAETAQILWNLMDGWLRGGGCGASAGGGRSTLVQQVEAEQAAGECVHIAAVPFSSTTQRRHQHDHRLFFDSIDDAVTLSHRPERPVPCEFAEQWFAAGERVA